jgi:hypothetical protein
MSADKLLTDAAQIMQERAKQYDSPTGERSMGKAVAAFNCVTGNKMKEAEGWLLLQLLKDVRQWSTPNAAHVDSLQDCIAYAALKAECIIEKTIAFKSSQDGFKSENSQWVEDKELPSSGIYGDAGYTTEDMRQLDDWQAASLVHDALRWAMTTHSNDDADWIEHAGKGCPLDDQDTLIHIKVASGEHYDAMPAEYANFLLPIGHEERITHWRYANKEQKQ